MFKYLIAVSISIEAWALHTGTPVTISDQRFDSVWPEVAIDREGRAAVSWLSYQGGRREALYVAYKEGEGKPWAEAERLTDWESEVGIHGCHFDASGNLSVFWATEIGLDDYLNLNRKPLGKAWGSALQYPHSEYFSRKAVAFEPNGDLIGTVVEKRTASDSWSQECLVQLVPFSDEKREPLHLSLKRIYSSNIVLDQEGDGFIYWQSEEDSLTSGPVTTFTGISKSAKNRPRQAETICQLDGDSFYTSDVAANYGKHGALVIGHQGKLKAVVHFEGKWSEVAEIADLEDSSFLDIALDIDPNGNVLTVWQSEKGSQEVLFASYKQAGQPWSTPLEGSLVSYEVAQPRVAYDGAGHFVIVWTQVERNAPAIWAAQFSIEDATLSKPELLSPVGRACHSPAIAFAKGKGIISWITTDNGFDPFLQAADLIVD